MKASAVIIRLHRPLRFLPRPLVEALSRIAFGWIRGIDETHDRRWKRIMRRLFHTRDLQPVLQFYPVLDRSGKFHRMHMSMEGRVFEYQEAFPLTKAGREAFRDWLKTGAHFGHWEGGEGQLVFVPDSVSYEDCSDLEMIEFHEAAMEFLRSPLALSMLWPAVKPEHRTAMLEAALREPEEEQP
jgi:hypothetical protein